MKSKAKVDERPQKGLVRRICPKALRPPLQRMRELQKSLTEDAMGAKQHLDPYKRGEADRLLHMAQGVALVADMYLDWADDIHLALKADSV